MCLRRTIYHRTSCSSCCSSLLESSPTEIYPLSLHDALPIYPAHMSGDPATPMIADGACRGMLDRDRRRRRSSRSEEHTSELQSRFGLVCRLLLEKKKKKHSCCR